MITPPSVTRPRRAYRFLRKKAKRASSYVMSAEMWLRNRTSSSSVLGSAPAVVSLTTHGARIETVALTIESVAAGRVKPRQLLLWLDDRERFASLPRSLRRLQRRGLEIGLTDNLGPHTKYYPSLAAAAEAELPLVTADDDILYPRWWLQRLCAAAVASPNTVNCLRASVVTVVGAALQPYAAWPRCKNTTASVAHFATGVSGVIYPPRMISELTARGTAFLQRCPRADDIWLHWVALQTGVEIRQILPQPKHFPYIPGTQESTLVEENLVRGGNDRWIAALYTNDDISVLRQAQGATVRH